MKKINLKIIIEAIILACFILAIGFFIYKIVTVPAKNIENIEELKVKSDYAKMIMPCLAGIIGIILPDLISIKAKIEIPSNLYISYILFVFGTLFLGGLRDYYYMIPIWDIVLHTLSGLIFGAVGFSFVSILNKQKSIELSPLFIAIFAFGFAIAIGVIWEIYEFTVDGAFGLNMQKFALKDGTNLIGRAALVDTMEDLIVDVLGTFVICLIGYISLKYKKGWIEKVLIKEKV